MRAHPRPPDKDAGDEQDAESGYQSGRPAYWSGSDTISLASCHFYKFYKPVR
jgi:hypothetical protein